MTENKKPLSLNQRHSRLLQDLSASHSRPSSHVPSTAQVKPSNIKFQGRRRLFNTISFEDSSADDEDGDDMPKFSVFSDLDSTPEEKSTEKSEKVILEGRRRLCRASARIDNDNIGLKFSEISEEQKMEKPEESGNVMLKDRRHLCKASPAVDDGYQGSKFSETSDFDSPAVAKNINRRDLEGANEIRSILNDLSSKLDFLSIEKNRIPKTIDQPNTADLSIPSDSTSDIASHYSPVSVVESKSELCDNREDSSGDSKDDDNSGTIRKLPITEGHIKNETSSDYGNNETSGQSMLSNAEEGQESDDSCVVLSNKGLYKSSHRQSSKFNGEVCSSSGVDLSDDEVSEQPFTLSGPESTYTLCGKLAKMLYPHQRDGLKWLWSLHCQGKGGILGDDMGLGKTMQICSFLAGLFQSCLIKRALIVAPKTLLSHWIKELSMVGLSGKTREYHGTSVRAREYELRCILQDKGVLLTTYDIVRNNSKSLCGDFHHNDEGAEDSITWDYMILDEGHLIKNPSTQRAKSLLEIPSAQRIIISGTPIQNNLKELWALFHFCCPELLHDKYWFKEKYEYKILRGNDKHASDRDKRIGSATAKELRDRIQPYFLRRLKSEVFGEDGANTAKVSKKNEIIVWLKLTSCQRQLYEAFLNSELVLSAFDGSPLAALTILKKICDHPMLLTKRAAEDVLEGMDSMMNHEDKGMAEKLAMHIADITERENLQEVHDNVSCKISFIMSLLDNLIPKGHNVLIFSQTRKMLNLIQESLTSNDYEFVRIDGTTKACDRVNIVNDFQESVGAPIFLLTSQVGGLGLTLTRADRVIVVDPAWNPSTDNQSVDRAYRIGQKKDVIVYRLMTCGTVEEKIYRKQIFKGGLFRTATEQKEQIRYFGQQDLRELFSLPKQGFDVSLTQQQLHEEHDSQYVMNAFLKDHIKFLETKGIAGVSHHSLLFSKTAPTITEEAEEGRMKAGAFAWGGASHEHDTGDGAGGLAFKPKDVDVRRGNSSVNSPAAPTESDIKAQIGRLTQIFADKVTISKLPDKGARIERRLAQLNCELERMKGEKEVIDLDDVTDELQRVLSV